MKDYWRKRQAQHIEDVLSKVEVSNKEIANIYAKSGFYINEQIQGIFDRYKKKHGLSNAEAKALLNKMEDSASYKEMLKKLHSGAKSEERKRLLKELDSPAYRYRINKLQESQKLVDTLMQSVYNQEKDISTLNYINIAHDAYYKSIYNLQQGTGLAFSFDDLDPEIVDKLLKSKWSGKNYSERIWDNTCAVAESVKEEMLLGILTGKTESEMMKTITDRFLVGSYQARRLINTESAFICNVMDLEAYQEADIEMVRFCAVHDLKTSKICQQHDREVIDINKAVQGVNVPPMHPNCRSSIEPVIDEEIEAKMKRRVRNPVTGKDEIVNANETYEQWYKRTQGKKLDKINQVEESTQRNYKDKKDNQINDDKTIDFDNKNDKIRLKETEILSQEEIIKEAKKYADDLKNNPNLLRYDTGDPVGVYVNSKLGYDKLPTVVSSPEFAKLSDGKTILYRGVTDYKDISSEKMVEQFLYGDFYCGRGVYGYGTYTDIDLKTAQYYAYDSGETENGKIIEMILSDDAKSISYEEIFLEFEKTGIPKILGSVKEPYQQIIRNVGTYASIKGYDAILLNGFNNKHHVIVLNRAKLIVKG